MVNWEIAAIRGAIQSIDPARWNTIVIMEIAAPPSQPATGPTTLALACALRQTRTHIIRTAHVPEQPSKSAPEQFQPHLEHGLYKTHTLCYHNVADGSMIL